MREFFQHLDHPLLFLFFLVLALTGLKAVMAWAAYNANLPGASDLLKH